MNLSSIFLTMSLSFAGLGYLHSHCQGMVDPGDTVSATLKKEFGEEAMNSLEADPEEKKKIEKQINQLFTQGEEVNYVSLLLIMFI